MMKRMFLSLLMVAWVALPVYAQQPVAKSDKGTVGAENTWVTLDNVSGYGSVGGDIRGTFVANLQIQCSVDGTNYLAVRVTPPNSTTAATILSAPGEWANGAIAGCWKVRIGIPSGEYTSGSATVVIRAVATGGGGGSGAGGGGGGGDFDIATFQTTFGTNPIFLGTGADNVANTQDHLAIFNYIFDGSTWDRWTGAVTVGGTVAVTQSGSWDEVGINDSGNSITVDGAVAVTNAGTFATQVDGAALTALQLIDNLPNTLGSTTSGQSGALALGAVTTAAPSYTNAQSNALSLTTAGLLRVAVEAGGGTGGTSSDFAAAFPATGTAVGMSDGTNMVAFLGTTTQADNLANTLDGLNTTGFTYIFDGSTWDRWTGAVTQGTNPWIVGDGSGALNTIVDSGTITTVSTVTSVTGTTNWNSVAIPVQSASLADDVALTQDVLWVANANYCYDGTNLDLCRTATGGSGVIDANTGRMTIATDDPVNDALVALDSALNADEAAFTYATTQTLAIGAVAESTSDAIADGLQGAVNMTLDRKLWVQPRGYLSGGGAPIRRISAGSTEDEHAVCTGPCTLYSILVTNTNAAARYLKCHNDTAANTDPGTDTVHFGIALHPSGGASYNIPIGTSFSTALTCWIVTGAADSDVAEVAANEIMVNYTKVE